MITWERFMEYQGNAVLVRFKVFKNGKYLCTIKGKRNLMQFLEKEIK